MIKMNEENKMYEYLLEHNYISKNENKNPLRQQELSKERAECIANKYNNLVEEKTKVALANHKYASQCEDKVIVLQNNWNELKELLQKQINACDKYVKCYKDELQQKGARSNGKTYLQREILKNQIAGLTFSLILADMKKKEGNNESSKSK